ncbi:MAG TPA: TetR/AcrR family transcriptional regulator [Segeticoccus sp.]|uniref:TetR/AcrR family transcriptional regulator n=1 Tax=Segeticoccus sp. TaxID=2706531 RepID=UPI002D7EFA7E|nr:TetR/AcrR family transcriptional regulator [Segeticoccus sp.]HET8599808.1 TetR/AcrR family transcriptional regulator [Segeticoccus sp.]
MSAGTPAGSPPGRPRRGRAPTRSSHEIAAAGVALADRDGLPAVTMRALARALGTGAASLYRYLRTREELLELMVEEVNGEFDLGEPDRRPWLDQMMDLAQQARCIYRRHPWMLQALDTTPALGPHGLAYLDHALAVLAPTGADGRTKLEAIGVFSALVRLLCKQEHDQRRADVAPSAQQTKLTAQLTAAASTGSYPHLTAALADAGPTDDQFDRILRRVTTGLLPHSN